MKNFCLYGLMLIFTSLCFGQLENSRWIFGNDAGIQFTATTAVAAPIPNTHSFSTFEGSASVCNANGDLLFFTNGVSVWRNTNTGPEVVITNQLRGNISSVQNVIIIPRPNNPNNYYIVTSHGFTGTMTTTGLYFSEISLATFPGTVVSLNTPLPDSNGTLVGLNYGQRSEALTSARHANGTDYWLVAGVRNTGVSQINSYKVTANGFTLVANGSSSLPYMGDTKMIKISPDGQRIAAALGNGANLGSFDNTTGAVTFTTLGLLGGANNKVYGVEFSSNSQVLYFTNRGTSSLNSVLVTNPTVINTISANLCYFGLQLAINGRIYINTSANCATEAPGTSLSVISNPNNFSSPQFSYNSFAMGRDCNLSLPQIVHRHVNATCPSAWALFNPVDNVGPLTQHHRQAIKQINTSNIVSSGATAVYHAGDFVLLRDGFHATAGSRFRAYIEGCSDIFVGKSAEEKEEHQVIANGNEISIAPNPGTNLVQVTSENSLITDIHVYNLQGRLIFAQKASASFVDLNVSSLASGIYVVTIQTEDGKVFNKKLMKN